MDQQPPEQNHGDVAPPSMPPSPEQSPQPVHPPTPPSPPVAPPEPPHAMLQPEPVIKPAPGQVLVDGKQLIPAGLLWRTGAFLIDAIVLGILHQVLLLLTGFSPPDVEQMTMLLERLMSEWMASGTMSAGLEQDAETMLAPLRFAGWLNVATCAAYFTVFHGMLGATLGKLCLGLTVRLRDGSALGYGKALLRYGGYLLLAKLAYTAWLVPWNAEQRTLYDMVFGTNVFRSKPVK